MPDFISPNGPYLPLWAQRIPYLLWAYLCEKYFLTQSSSSTAKPKEVKLEGKRGYMASKFQLTGIETQKSDVYSFGVVVLELLSGEEGLKFLFDKGNGGGYKRVNVIDTAREASEESGGGGVRKWVIGY